MEIPNIEDIGKLSAPVLLVLFCNIVGVVINKTPIIENKYIPLLMFFLGALIYPFLGTETANQGVVRQIVIGACIGGAAVGTNQLVRQFLNKDEKPTS